MVRLQDESDCQILARGESEETAVSEVGGFPAPPTALTPLPRSPPTNPHENNNHVMAFSRTLRQKLRANGFRSVSQASTPTGHAPKGMGDRQTSETPSTSSRMVTIVQNIYVYVSGHQGPETAFAKPLRLRAPKSTDEQFLEDGAVKYRACCLRCHVTRAAFVIGLVELVFAAMNLVDAIRNAAAVEGRNFTITSLEVFFAVCFIGAVVAMLVGVRTERKALLIPHLVWSVLFVVIGCVVIIFILAAWLFAGSLLAWTLATAQSNVQQSFDTLGERTSLANATKSPPPGLSVDYNTDDEDGRSAKDYFEPPEMRRLRREAGAGVEGANEEEETREESKTVKNVLWGIVVLLVLVFLIVVALEIWFFLIIRACYDYLRDKERFLTTVSTDGVVVHKPLAVLEERDSEDDL